MSLTPRINTFERNLVVNGNFDHWQRATTFSSSIRTYGADRWIHFTGNGAFNSSISRQISGLTSSTYCIRAQRPNGQTNTNYPYVCQVTETDRTITSGIRGNKIYLRFMARKGANFASTTSQITTYVGSGLGTNEPGPGNNIFTGESTVIAATPVTLTTSWQEFQLEGTVPSGCRQLRLEFVGMNISGTAGAADYYEIAEVSITRYKTSQFVYAAQDVSSELSLCQRYFEKTYAVGTPVGAGAGEGSVYFWAPTSYSNAAALQHSYKVTKRTTPTITIYNPGTTNDPGKFYNGSSGIAYPAIPANVTEENFLVNLGPGASLTQGQLGQWHWTADAEI